MKFFLGDLNLNPNLHLTSIYSCGMTTTPRMRGSNTINIIICSKLLMIDEKNNANNDEFKKIAGSNKI